MHFEIKFLKYKAYQFVHEALKVNGERSPKKPSGGKLLSEAEMKETGKASNQFNNKAEDKEELTQKWRKKSPCTMCMQVQ